MAQVSYGTITITDTNDIESIYMEYAQSTSNQTAPTSGWDTDIPTWRQGYYIWQRTVTKMSGVPLSSDSYGEPICLTGSTGSTGATGRGVSSIVTTYCNYGTGEPAASYSGWQSTVPTYDSTKPNYWVKTVITYTTGTPATDTTIYKDNGITNATSTAAAANSTAQAASNKADSAWSKADNAETIAGNANSAISDLNQYFWRQKTATTNVPAGSYVTNIPGTTYKNDPAQGGFNSLVQATGIFLRNGITTLSSWTGTALTFNNPSSGNAQLIIGANGTLQSGNYTRGSDSKFSSNGTKIDLINGDIITKYFRVSQGLETGLNAGVYVHGTIEALDGTIGTDSTNYWEIGNGTDYNLSSTAKMIGHGSSYIQLGDSSTWRLATNRIHTGWYVSSDSLLHYPSINSKYWDFGLHTPAAATEKFLYIRKSKANTSASNTLTNLLYDIDDTYATPQWDYVFYISADGSLYAKNLYVLDENGNATQIGGTDGVYLLKSGGTMTGSITMSNGGKFIGDLTGNADSATTATTATQVSKNLKIQLNSGTTEGTNQFTYNGSAAKNINITKSSIGLGNVENTALSTWAGSSSLTTVKVGTLAEAATRGVDTSISAASTSTKLPTSAAVAAFVEGKGYLTSYTETDPTVPSWAKTSSKPSYGLTEISGTDDLRAIEALTGTSGFLKKTAANTWTLDTNTYLTSYTETDPIFKASAAYGISSTDISNWNSKTSNTGTVTSVAASGSGGITISGSPITTSGTITIGLNLSTAINGLGEGTSNANRNDYIVAQYASGGTTTTTYHRRSLAHIFAALNSSDITTALGYTPYNSTNPNGYITANHTSTYSLPIAKYNTLGGVKPAYSSTSAASLTTAAATNTTTPTIAAKTTTSGRYYAVEVDKNGILFVNVPWTNVNSSYLTSSSTLNWNNVTQNRPTTASGYGITDAITNVSATSASGGSTTFTLTKSNGTTSSFDVVVYASAATQATDANYLTDGTTRYSVGSAKKPIYFDGGIPKASDGTEGTSTKPVYLSSGTITAGSTYAGGTKVTLNNSDKGASTASFYAPTTGGTTSQVLIGNGTTSAPVWTNISSLVPTNAGTADAFSSAATVALTGDTTGSASSTKGWSITTKTDRISTVGDNRAVATTPNDYVNKIIFQGLKTNSSFGSPSTDSYSYVVGLRGWSDSSGGNSHEFAFNNSGINHRSGATTSWSAWEKLITSSNYTDYTVTKTGSGASGTWGINISGKATTAGTADVANSVAWANITGKPINFITNSASLSTNGWKTLGGRTAQNSIAISYANSSQAAWNSGSYSASIVFGCQDTKGMLDVGYSTPIVSFGGGSVGGSTDNAPTWYFKLSGTSGQTYTFPSTSKTLVATDGTGASGTWGISISGNAATATKATQDGDGNTITTSYLRRFPWWNSGDTHNIDDLRAGITFAYGGTHNGPTTGTVVAFDCSTNTAYTLQLMGTYNAFNDLYFRNCNGDNGTWGDWRRVVYNSGTWSINITGNAAIATKATQDGSGNTITSTYVKKAGDTMTGALNTANGIANKIGDDSQLGDFNIGGTLGIQGLNGTTGIALLKYGDTWGQSANYAHINYDGTYVNLNKLFKITTNSNTVTIGSQNSSFTHIYNSTSIPFIFNNSILTTSGSLGNNTYPFTNVNINGAYNMLVSGAQKAAMHYDSTLDAIVFSFA